MTTPKPRYGKPEVNFITSNCGTIPFDVQYAEAWSDEHLSYGSFEQLKEDMKTKDITILHVFNPDFMTIEVQKELDLSNIKTMLLYFWGLATDYDNAPDPWEFIEFVKLKYPNMNVKASVNILKCLPEVYDEIEELFYKLKNGDKKCRKKLLDLVEAKRQPIRKECMARLKEKVDLYDKFEYWLEWECR